MTQIAQPSEREAGLDPLARFQLDLEVMLRAWADSPDEAGGDPLWIEARQQVREFTLRPAKRVRPQLVALGWLLADEGRSPGPIPSGVVQFAAGLELLHTFMLIHDDVADTPPRGVAGRRCITCSRRGGWGKTSQWWQAITSTPARSRPW